ncbi:MAG: hypothetical protein NVV59_04110 [Chitinophagaceae bacterium]|nr:hypothetical protein [Chitinophagaceae bacterium]
MTRPPITITQNSVATCPASSPAGSRADWMPLHEASNGNAVSKDHSARLPLAGSGLMILCRLSLPMCLSESLQPFARALVDHRSADLYRLFYHRAGKPIPASPEGWLS